MNIKDAEVGDIACFIFVPADYMEWVGEPTEEISFITKVTAKHVVLIDSMGQKDTLNSRHIARAALYKKGSEEWCKALQRYKLEFMTYQAETLGQIADVVSMLTQVGV